MPAPSDLQFHQISKSFGRNHVLKGLDLTIPAGSFVALMGANGAGKTTLLRLAGGLAVPTSGSVTVSGIDMRKAGPGLRRMIGWVSHESLLYADLTGRANLRFHANLFGVADPEARIAELAEALDLHKVLDRPAGVLSRGNRQRITLARALLHGPDILLLDEPFTGLDEASASRLVEILRLLHAEGRTIILTVHEIARAYEGATRLIVIENGKVGVDRAVVPNTSTELAPVQQLTTRPALIAPPNLWRAAGQVAAKDLRVEWRSRDMVGSAGLFSFIVLITTSFTTPPGGGTQGVTTGILWISLLFAVLLGVGRSMGRESADRAIEGLMLAPTARESVFLGKLLAGMIMMSVIELFVVPMFIVLVTTGQMTTNALELIGTVFLATLGLVIVSTLFSGVAAGSRLGDSLLPLLVMPLVIPLMIAAVETTRRALGGATAVGAVGVPQWIGLLGGFDLVVGVAAFATFAFVMEEQ